MRCIECLDFIFCWWHTHEGGGAVQLQVQVLYEQIDREILENVLHFVIQRILKHTFSQGGTERRCIN